MQIRPIILFTFLVLGIYAHETQAQYGSHFGISAGAMILSGGNGFLFETAKGQPHREYGFSLGLDLYYPLAKDLHLMIGAHGQYEETHFHLGLGERFHDTGNFRYGYFSVPITLNHMGNGNRKRAKIKEYFGFAFNFGNRLPPNTGAFIRNPYLFTADVQQKLKINPEFIMGIGVGGRYHSYGIFHWQLGLHIDLLPNQIFTARLTPTDPLFEPQVSVREVRGVKLALNLLFFPRINVSKKQCYRN